MLGYERQGQPVIPNDYGTNYGQQFGIPNTNGPDPRQSGFPNIAPGNYTGFGVPNWMPVTRVEESWTQSDNITYVHGAHEFRFGFDLVRHHLNHWQPEIGNGPRGYLGFGGGPTALSGGPASNQYNGYATFLLGLDTSTDKSLQYILSTGREWQFGWYARDRWQVSRNLTINIGLRYEYYPLMTRAGKGIERYDPGQQPGLPGRPRQHSGKRGNHGEPQALRPARRYRLSPRRQDGDPLGLRNQLRPDSVLAPASRLVSARDRRRQERTERLLLGPARSSRAFRTWSGRNSRAAS